MNILSRDRSCNITVFYGSENLCNLTVRFDKFHYILRGVSDRGGIGYYLWVSNTTINIKVLINSYNRIR